MKVKQYIKKNEELFASSQEYIHGSWITIRSPEGNAILGDYLKKYSDSVPSIDIELNNVDSCIAVLENVDEYLLKKNKIATSTRLHGLLTGLLQKDVFGNEKFVCSIRSHSLSFRIKDFKIDWKRVGDPSYSAPLFIIDGIIDDPSNRSELYHKIIVTKSLLTPKLKKVLDISGCDLYKEEPKYNWNVYTYI